MYEPHPDEARSNVTRMSWSKRIRAGLDQGLLVPYRQPIVKLRDRTVAKYELLARLLDERGNPTLPGAFMPTAERAGMVRDVDRLMVTYAIELIADSASAGRPVAYEVNLSARSLTDPGLPSLLAAELNSSGIDPSLLVFEITETAAIANMEQVWRFARTIRDLGCSFALDDFGAGFASFYYLKYIPLDWLKIDGDFIRDLPHNSTDQLVVKHIAGMAHSLGLLPIAEFVEDEETLQMLGDFGVDYVQGYHLGHPDPAAIRSGVRGATVGAGPQH